MITNQLFRDCLKQVSAQTRNRFDFIFSVAEKIVAVMEKKGINNALLAHKMNVSESTVSKWLTGRYDFSLSQLIRLSEVLGEPLVEVKN